jgi:glycosyltransferase involved in cell wall biosynthesis
MNQVRITGDAFGEGHSAGQLRSFLRAAQAVGLECHLALDAAAAGRPPLPGEQVVPLTDGARNLTIGTRLPPAEVQHLLRANEQDVASTAPLLVFGEGDRLDDLARLAGLAWPKAAVVLPVRSGVGAAELVDRVRAELRWAGSESPLHALPATELTPWLRLPAPTGDGPIVHVGGTADDGVDLVLAACRDGVAAGRPLRLVVPGLSDDDFAALRASIGSAARSIEILRREFRPADAADASVVVLPYRRFTASRVLVQALASGRPVVVSRFAATAGVLDAPGICLPVGGQNVDDADGARFAPHPQALRDAVQNALADAVAAAAIARRARRHVAQELTANRSSMPPRPSLRASASGELPVVVLEAPFFETSSTSELSIATAVALQQRGNVELKLRPVGPFRHDLTWLRARAPQLEPLLCRDPGRTDLWLSSGWPVRAARPECGTWAQRIDWEYGFLPVELTPHATTDADVVVVHSEHVARTMCAAGRPLTRIRAIPHGVDDAMHEAVAPDAEIVRWKGDRAAVLFCGGLIWRKGIDVFLQTVLAAWQQGHRFVVVVKASGGDHHYSGHHLRALVDRFRGTPGTPPLLLVERDVGRDELAGIYAACDVLVHPYRGEGFGLPVLEARAVGLPVIATGLGATEAFLTGPGAHRIPARRRNVDLPGAHLGTPWVLEPEVPAGAQLLGQVLDDLAAERRAARSIAAAVRTAFSWSAAAALVEQLANEATAGRRQQNLPDRVLVPTAPNRTPVSV